MRTKEKYVTCINIILASFVIRGNIMTLVVLERRPTVAKITGSNFSESIFWTMVVEDGFWSAARYCPSRWLALW